MDGRVVVLLAYAAVWVGQVDTVVLGVVLEACQTRVNAHGRTGGCFRQAIVEP